MYGDNDEESTDMCKDMYDNSVKCNINLPMDYSDFDVRIMSAV
jgi:hypothetical protein